MASPDRLKDSLACPPHDGGHDTTSVHRGGSIEPSTGGKGGSRMGGRFQKDWRPGRRPRAATTPRSAYLVARYPSGGVRQSPEPAPKAEFEAARRANGESGSGRTPRGRTVVDRDVPSVGPFYPGRVSWGILFGVRSAVKHSVQNELGEEDGGRGIGWGWRYRFPLVDGKITLVRVRARTASLSEWILM